MTPWPSTAGFTSSLLVKESVIAEAVEGLLVPGFDSARLLVFLEGEAGT